MTRPGGQWLWTLVFSYEEEIRKAALKRVAQGETLDEALRAAWEDPLLKDTFFTTPLAMVVHAPPPRTAEGTKSERPQHATPAAKRQKMGTQSSGRLKVRREPWSAEGVEAAGFPLEDAGWREHPLWLKRGQVQPQQVPLQACLPQAFRGAHGVNLHARGRVRDGPRGQRGGLCPPAARLAGASRARASDLGHMAAERPKLGRMLRVLPIYVGQMRRPPL